MNHSPADISALAGLLAAYVNTRYQAVVHGAPVVLSVGQPCERLKALGRETPWALITPFNPGSKKLSDEQNEGRLRTLHQNLASHRGEVFPAVSIDPQGHWPDEKGVLVAALDREHACRLAGFFGQHALLAGYGAGPVELVLLGPEWAGLEYPDHVVWLEQPGS